MPTMGVNCMETRIRKGMERLIQGKLLNIENLDQIIPPLKAQNKVNCYSDLKILLLASLPSHVEPSWLVTRLPPRWLFPNDSHYGSLLSVRVQIKCHLLRRASSITLLKLLHASSG